MVDMGEDDERQYMRVPKEHAEAVMSKLANAGLIDENADVRWEELQELFDSGKKIGPWFRLIKENFLNNIWNTLDDLNKATDDKLHKMDECQ